jgi:hypothetical protein
MRHDSMGTMLLQQSGQITQGQTIDLGKATLPANQQEALFTLNWPGSRLEPLLVDPKGIPVKPTYPGANITKFGALVSITIANPLPGNWNITIVGEEVPEGNTDYHVAFSTRGQAASITPQNDAFMIILILIILVLVVVIYNFTSQRRPRYSSNKTGAFLIGSTGLFAGVKVHLGSPMTIGRRSDCQLVLHDLSVSRQHASMYLSREGWVIEDLHSKGGTFINRNQITRIVLREGDSIQIGKSTFVFHP